MSDYDGVVGVVEATDYELLCLYKENRDDRFRSLKTWEDSRICVYEIVGTLTDMPVCISIKVIKVDGHKILVYSPTSQIVDHAMIREWLVKNLPKTAFRANGILNKTDAINFYNLFTF